MSDGKHQRVRPPVMLPAIICLLLAVPALAVHDSMVRIRVGDSRSQAASFYADRHSISVGAAEQWIRHQEREKGVRVLDDFDLPEGTLMDFYRVRNHRDPEKRVEFEGRGRLIHAYSFLGRHYREILFGLIRSDVRDEAIALLRQARDHGFMIVPAAIDDQAGSVRAAQAPTITAIVIIPEFPHWNDPRPISDGNTIRQEPPGSADMYFHPNVPGDPRRTYPMANNNPAWEEYASDYYADSPGGALVGGIPVGKVNTGAWSGMPDHRSNSSHPRAGGVEFRDQVELQNRWYNLVFNKSFTNSLTNYFFQNTHGHIDIQGSPSHIIGWQTDHHQLDRIRDPYFGGEGTYYAVQPGTPLLRPTPHDAADPGIVRASFYQEGGQNRITLFFKQDTYGLSTAHLEVWAYTSADTDNDVSGTQPGIVRIAHWGNSTLVMDPWDARRWTLREGSTKWRFRPFEGVPEGGDLRDFVYVSGQTWRVYSTRPTNGVSGSRWEWSSSRPGSREDGGSPGNPNWRASSQGCGSLPNTLFDSSDIVQANNTSYVGNSEGNRLLSFCYYVHDYSGEYTFSASANAYQLTTLYQGSYTDPIAGTDSTAGRRRRPAPFDHDIRCHQAQFRNSGNVFGGGTPGHSSNAMRGHVYQMLNDRGISYTGYDRQIFVFPGTAQSEGDPNAEIIPHADGTPGTLAVVPEGTGLQLLAHEVGHTFGMVDLYDNHLYDNMLSNPVPYYFESRGAGTYSVMAHGIRIDPWHKQGGTYGPWARFTPVTNDLGFTQIFQVEQTLQDPVILKMPAHPLAIYASKNTTAPAGFPGGQAAWDNLGNPGAWQEYYLVENRNVTGGSYFGDPSPRGLYIWHIDMRNIGGFQRNEQAMSVVPVQADGRRELQNRGARAPFGGFGVGDGDTAGDPFPGSWGNRNWTERSVEMTPPAGVPAGTYYSPTSWSNGAPDTGGSSIMPGTPTDSFVRVTDIRGPQAGPGGTPNAAGDPMTAYIFVEPAEVVVTGQTLIPAPDPGKTFYEVPQGTEDFEVLLLTLDNDGVYPNLSTNPVTINTIRIHEVGTSLRDENIAVAKLYEDTDGSGDLTPSDILLNTAQAVDDYIEFTNLGYTLPLRTQPTDPTRQLILAYDIARDAQTSPTVTIGAELTTHEFVVPNHPGAVQQRVRTDGGTANTVGYMFGAHRFPVPGPGNRTARIIPAPDTLYVESHNLAPATAVQGQNNVPIMQLELSVDADSVTIGGIKVHQLGTAEGGADVSIVRAYHDRAGNGVIDPGDTRLGEAAVVGGAGAGVANITGIQTVDPATGDPIPFRVTDVAHEHVILAVNVTPGATENRTIQLSLPDEATISLVQQPSMPPDVVSPSGFPHTHAESPATITTIIPANRPPFPPPPPNDPTYGDLWAPKGGVSIEDQAPECFFPRARDLANDPPGVPDPDTAYDTADVMRYEAQFSTSSTFATIAHTQTIVPPYADDDRPRFEVSVALPPARYYWRVRTIDTHGAQSPWSSPAAVFVIVERPTPPTAAFWPSGGITITNPTPTYSWTMGTDGTYPRDELRTVVQVDDNSDFSSLHFEATALAGENTLANPVASPLIPGVRYYWRAKTRNPDNIESEWSAVQNFWMAENSPPNPIPGGFAPVGNVAVTTLRPTLQWTRTTDPNHALSGGAEDPPEQLYYQVQLSETGDWTQAPLWTVNTRDAGMLPHDETPVLVPVGMDLTDNEQYFWRVRARDRPPTAPRDDGLWSDWSGTHSFWVDETNNPPFAPETGFAPANSTTINDQRPRLRVNQAFDPDPMDFILRTPPATPVWPGNAMRYIFQLRPHDDDLAAGYTFQYTTMGTATPAFVEVQVTDDLADLTDWYWRVRAQDQHGALSPWSEVQHFRVDIGTEPPTLTPPNNNPALALQPKYGDLTTSFEFRVVYTDADNDPPDYVAVELYKLDEIDGRPEPGEGERLMLSKQDPLATNYAAGIIYTRAVPGGHAALGYGRHGFRFFTYTDEVSWPDPAPSADDDMDADPGQGPVVGSPATIAFMAANWTEIPEPPTPGYEEGDTIRVEVQDADRNLDKNVAETVEVTLHDTGMTDVETLVLTETGPDTGIFRGSIPMLGRAGESGDGVLNVIAGPTGNTITALYEDRYYGRQQTQAAPVTRRDRALVVDTTPPVPIGAQLIVENGPDGHGRSLLARWPDYDITTSPSQVDIVGYEVYYSAEGPFTITDLNDELPPDVFHAATVTPATTMQYVITGLEPDTDYWVAVVPKDEVPNIAAADSVGPTRTRDVQPPTLVAVTPARNATEVPLTTPIIFRIQDPGVGIDEDTVRVWVSVDGGAPLEITTPPDGWSLTRSGPMTDRQYDYRPPAGFLGLNQQVEVQVRCDDNQPSPNRMDDSYVFDMRTDVLGPEIVDQTPAPDATDVLPTAPIRFRITDDRAGVDVDSLQVLINGEDVTDNCIVDASDPLNVRVTYPATPPSIVPWDAEVTVTVNVADNVGNDVQDPNFWTFTTQADEDPPAISNLSPAAGATNVRIDTSVGFRLTDAKSGINTDSLEVYLNDTQVPDADLVKTGTPNALNVSFDPPTLLDYEQLVTVRVVVEDNAGNALPGEEPEVSPLEGYSWQFTTRPAPRFRITGTITVMNQPDTPVPAVTIRALDAETGDEITRTRTDGNGTYIVEIELGGTFRIIPSRDEWDFSPAERTVRVDGADVTGQDFEGTRAAYSISGRVTVGGVGLPGVTVSDGTRSAVTDSEGDYTIIGVPNGRYTVTPSLPGHTFRPTSRTVTIAGASETGVDFEAVGRTYTISGIVQDYDGNRLQGVRLTAGTRSAISNEAGQYTIGDVPTGTWDVRAEKSGYSFTPEAIEVQVPPDATGVNFTAHMSFANSFPQGINMIAVPCHPADPDPVAVFGTTAVARWNPNLTPPDYVMPSVGPGQELLEVRPGRGFFVRLAEGTLEVPGRPVSTARPFTLTLGPVWNMAGNMYTSALPFANIVPGLPGAIRQYGYVYDAARGDYLLVSGMPGVNVARTVIYPWEGVWLRTAVGGATASVHPPVESADAQTVKPQSMELGAGGWTMSVVARAGDRRDTTTAVGVGPALQEDLQVANPPMAPSTVDAYITAADGRYLAQDVRAGAATTLSWDLVVTTDLAGADVELTLPDLSEVPHDLAVYLTDLDSNRRIYARTMNAHTFTAGDAGDRRRFRLEVAPRSEAGLVVTNATAAAAGGGVVVSYSVSKACKVSVRVTNIAGRVIRTVSDGRNVAAGVNTVNWDLKSGAGTPVPNGRYLFRISVVGEDGQQAQAVASAMVRR